MADARGATLIERLAAATARLEAIAARPMPGGRTDPSPGGEETWGATQVWGHLSEFPGYWTASARRVLAAPHDAPATFGRRIDDPSRVDAIAAALGEPVEVLLARCREGVEEARRLAASLRGEDWERIGIHVVRGEVTVGTILESFVANHLDEHAAQLEGLAAAARR